MSSIAKQSLSKLELNLVNLCDVYGCIQAWLEARTHWWLQQFALDILMVWLRSTGKTFQLASLHDALIELAMGEVPSVRSQAIRILRFSETVIKDEHIAEKLLDKTVAWQSVDPDGSFREWLAEFASWFIQHTSPEITHTIDSKVIQKLLKSYRGINPAQTLSEWIAGWLVSLNESSNLNNPDEEVVQGWLDTATNRLDPEVIYRVWIPAALYILRSNENSQSKMPLSATLLLGWLSDKIVSVGEDYFATHSTLQLVLYLRMSICFHSILGKRLDSLKCFHSIKHNMLLNPDVNDEIKRQACQLYVILLSNNGSSIDFKEFSNQPMATLHLISGLALNPQTFNFWRQILDDHLIFVVASFMGQEHKVQVQDKAKEVLLILTENLSYFDHDDPLKILKHSGEALQKQEGLSAKKMLLQLMQNVIIRLNLLMDEEKTIDFLNETMFENKVVVLMGVSDNVISLLAAFLTAFKGFQRQESDLLASARDAFWACAVLQAHSSTQLPFLTERQQLILARNVAIILAYLQSNTISSNGSMKSTVEKTLGDFKKSHADAWYSARQQQSHSESSNVVLVGVCKELSEAMEKALMGDSGSYSSHGHSYFA